MTNRAEIVTGASLTSYPFNKLMQLALECEMKFKDQALNQGLAELQMLSMKKLGLQLQ